MEEKIEGAKNTTPGRRRNILYALLAAGVFITLFAARPITAAIQHGAGFHRPWGGHGGGHAMSPEAAKDHLRVATKWALRDVDASAEQQDRVNTIVAGTVDDLFRLRESHKRNRDAFHAELAAATVDRAALEEIRKSEMALADEASKRLVQALADVSDVLTPTQRQALQERVHRRHAN